MTSSPLSLRQRVTYAGRALRLVWDASGTLTVAWIAVLLVQGLIPVATVYLTKPLVDALQGAVGLGTDPVALRPLLTLIAAMGGLLVAAELLKVALQMIGYAQAEVVQDHIAELIHVKAVSTDIAFFESAELLDRLYRVNSDAATRPLNLLEGVGSLLQNTVSVIGIGALLLLYGPWVGAVLVIGTIPTFLVVARSSRIYHDWWMNTTADRRRTGYISGLLTGAGSAAEVRLFDLGQYFRSRYRALRSRLRVERLAILRRQSLSRLGAEGVTMAVAAGTIGWMGWRALIGLATLGDIARFYQAFQRGQGLVKSLFGNINQLHSNGLFLESLFDFLDMEPQVVAPARPDPVPARVTQGISFSNVTFRYPGTERYALRDFSLTVEAGTTVALVGANGAGKSTLVKLLARFYDPDTGSVMVDGVDLRRLDPAELRKLMTVMFQSPMPLQGTVRENITLSDVSATADERCVQLAAKDAGADVVIDRLPGGLDATLGRAFAGGTELSGGEWQRITMARAYYRQTPIVVFDEPTSHMDSWAEQEWIERFRARTKGCTAILVTHRLSLARAADAIHVLEAGRVVESGTHDELLRLNGRYSSSWQAQQDENHSPANP